MSAEELIRHFNQLCPVRMNEILRDRANKGDAMAAQILTIIETKDKANETSHF